MGNSASCSFKLDPLGSPTVAGVLLAGGRARRLGGGDKCLLDVDGRTLLDRVIERVRPQVGPLILNAGGDPARFSSFGLAVVPDPVEDGIEAFSGPLAGILAGLDWAHENAPQADFLAVFPTDAPFVPRDLVARQAEALQGGKADIAIARSKGRDHPVFALLTLGLGNAHDLRDGLREAMTREGVRKAAQWVDRYRVARVSYAVGVRDPFFNVNDPKSLVQAEDFLGKQ